MTIYFLLFFACLGSFSSACIYRFSHNEPIVWDRSRCPHCHHTLAWWQLIPILSWLFLKGECYYCHQKISVFYPLNEILHILLYLLLSIFLQNPVDILLYGCLFSLCYILSYLDVLYQEVPTILLILLLGISFIIAKPSNLLPIAIIILLLFIFYYICKDKIGFADILHLIAQSFLLSPYQLCCSIFLACLAALIYIYTRHQGTKPIPFLPFLSIGFICLIFINFS